MAETQKFHYALAVTNVKTLIPIILDMETAQYHSWVTLFKFQANIHGVIDHIILPTDAEALAAYHKTKEADPSLWLRLDNVVLQWIYATVSEDILNTILVQDDVALNAWNQVAYLFQDNKNTRAAYLETRFTTIVLADFSSIPAYCNRLQSLANQLANVGAPVSDTRLALRLLAGLPETYINFVTNMHQKEVLPTFTKMVSRLKMEHLTSQERVERDSASAALITVDDDSPTQHHPSHGHNNNYRPNNNYNGGRGNNPNYKGKKPYNNYRGKGTHNHHGNGNNGNNSYNSNPSGRGRGNTNNTY